VLWVDNRAVAELSDAERRRLERSLEKGRAAFARERQYAAIEREHRQRFGPSILQGPDGVYVRLEVLATGQARFAAETPSIRHVNAAVSYGVSTPNGMRRAFMRFGFVLTIHACGIAHRYRWHYAADEQSAARLFAQASSAVTSGASRCCAGGRLISRSDLAEA
jgi:hypothetical protein